MSTSEANQRKLSTVETRNLLRHATASSSTKQVASFIGVPDSRISEGKSGKWQLSHEQATRIRSEYGEPRAAAGQYLNGELWQSVNEIICSTTLFSRWNQWHRIKEILTKKEFSNYIIKTCSFDNIEDTYLSIINMIDSDAFQNWFRKNKDERIKEAIYDYFNYSSSSALFDIAYSHNIKIKFEREHGFLILALILGSLKEKQKEIEIEFECNLSSIPVAQADFKQQWPESIISAATKREMVLLGDVVLDDVFKINWKAQECILGLEVPYSKTRSGVEGKLMNHISQDGFQWAAIRILLTADLNYHMVINLESSERLRYEKLEDDFISLNYGSGPDDQKRLIVVRDIRVEFLFNWLRDIYNWLGADIPSFISLKEKIAIFGGYIPGAIYVD